MIVKVELYMNQSLRDQAATDDWSLNLRSVEMQITGAIELDSGDDAGDELEEDEESEVASHFLVVFPHGIGHAFEHIGMLAGMHSGHGQVFQKWEGLNSKRLAQILLLNILFNELVINRLAVHISSTEEHPGGEVVLVIYNVHGVETHIGFVDLFFFVALEDDDLVALFGGHDLFVFGKGCAYAFFAYCFHVDEVLFLLVEVLGLESRIRGGFPCPAATNLSK
jgi:hypothetical protein